MEWIILVTRKCQWNTYMYLRLWFINYDIFAGSKRRKKLRRWNEKQLLWESYNWGRHNRPEKRKIYFQLGVHSLQCNFSCFSYFWRFIQWKDSLRRHLFLLKLSSLVFWCCILMLYFDAVLYFSHVFRLNVISIVVCLISAAFSCLKVVVACRGLVVIRIIITKCVWKHMR